MLQTYNLESTTFFISVEFQHVELYIQIMLVILPLLRDTFTNVLTQNLYI